MRSFLNHISGRAFSLESKLKNEHVFNHFFSPIGVETEIRYADIHDHMKRLSSLCQSFADNSLQNESEVLISSIWNQFFLQSDWIGQHDSSIEQYYKTTKKACEQLRSLNRPEQNLLLQVVLRNLLIIGTNATSGCRITHFSSVDVTIDAVCLLCSRQIVHLFNAPYNTYSNNVAFSELIAFAKKRGGLPTTHTIWCEDPNDNRSKLSKLLHGKTMIATSSEITRFDCKQALLFYAVLLTALVEKLEAEYYG